MRTHNILTEQSYTGAQINEFYNFLRQDENLERREFWWSSPILEKFEEALETPPYAAEGELPFDIETGDLALDPEATYHSSELGQILDETTCKYSSFETELKLYLTNQHPFQLH